MGSGSRQGRGRHGEVRPGARLVDGEGEAVPFLPTIRRPLLREPRHVVACLRLLIFAALAVLGWTEPPVAPWLYWALTVVYGLTVCGYMVAHNRDYNVRRVQILIFLFDVLVVSALIVVRGQSVQPLVMSYFTVVFLAALLAGIGKPFWNGLLGTLVYTVVMGWGRPPHELLTLGLLGPAFFFFVIAVFMGHVASDALRRGRERAYAGAMSGALQRSTRRLRAVRDGHEAEERLRTLEVLCAGIAHELRRPVAALGECTRDGATLLADLAGGDESAGAELASLFTDLQHESGRIGQVVSALGEFGRGGSAQQALVPGADIVAGARRLAAHEFEGPVKLQIDTRCEAVVRGDPARLVHAVAILMGNARDAVADGGTVRITADDTADGAVRLEVRDDGPGIPPEVRERMFDPFYTTKGPGRGTGLGLYVAREIARAAGGALRCESTPGRGAAFTLVLPAVQVCASAEADAA